jgi:stage V sporulation protein G
MEITEVRIKLMEDPSERLQAFCSITFDDAFVIRDLKIIEGANGPFVAMPSRKLTAHCQSCGCKNHLRAGFCNQCGARLAADRLTRDEEGRTKLYADIAHPINSACREMIQERVITEFRGEQERAKLPGYVSRYEDIDVDYVALQTHASHSSSPPAPHHRPSVPERPSASAREPSPREAATGHAADAQSAEPAEHLPRAPHRPPAQAPSRSNAIPRAKPQPPPESSAGSAPRHASPPTHGDRGPDAFGAGIF